MNAEIVRGTDPPKYFLQARDGLYGAKINDSCVRLQEILAFKTSSEFCP